MILSINGLFATLSIYDTQHNNTAIMLSVVVLSVKFNLLTECRYAECLLLNVVKLNVLMLSVIMLNVVVPVIVRHLFPRLLLVLGHLINLAFH